MRAWKRRIAMLEMELKASSRELDPADFDVDLFIKALAWLGLPDLAVTSDNWRVVLKSLTDGQLSHAARWFETMPTEKSPYGAPPLGPSEVEKDIEIQHALFRAGFFREFRRIDFETPGRTYETLGCIDLAKLTDAELAVLDHGDPQ